jgi:hypothetical protein
MAIKPYPQLTGLRGPALARAILTLIEDEVAAGMSAWDQSVWFRVENHIHPDTDAWIQANETLPHGCGTSGCFAGHAVFTQGAKLSRCEFDMGATGDRWFSWGEVKRPDGRIEAVQKWAAELLELDEEQADTLFNGSNSLEDLRRMVAALEDDPHADLWRTYPRAE